MPSDSIASSPISIHENDEDKELDPIGRIVTSGDQNEYVHFGGHKYLRSDVAYAFGGTFNAGVSRRPHLKIGNASPLALLGYATTTVMLSLINAGARGLKNQNHAIMLGSALFYGGAVQVIAGFWELALENTFAGTVFASYGGFWMSFSVLTMHGFNIEESYESSKDYNNAMGIFMLMWTIISAMFVLCLIRSTIPMFFTLLTTTLSDACATGASFAVSINQPTAGARLTTAGGIFGCISGFFALYNAMAGLLNKENSYIDIKPLYMPGALRPSPDKPKEA